MNIEALIQEKSEQFEKISNIMQQKNEQFQAEMSEMQSELLRLQGEYRLLIQLKEVNNNEEEDLPESLNAEVIEE